MDFALKLLWFRLSRRRSFLVSAKLRGATLTFVLLLGPIGARAEDWSSKLLERVPILIENPSFPLSGGEAPPPAGEPVPVRYLELPAPVFGLLGAYVQRYESFVVARVAPENLGPLQAALHEAELSYSLDFPGEIELPFSRFRPGSSRQTTAPKDYARPVPGLFVAQFGYPIRSRWLEELKACGIEIVASLQHWAFLLKAPSRDSVTACSPAKAMTWVGSYLAGDRVPASLAGGEEGDFTLQYLPGTMCSTLLAALPGGVSAMDEAGHPIDAQCRGMHGSFLRIRAQGEGLRQLIVNDPNLLTLLPTGEAAFSDERQGQIVAGNHNGISLTGPGYKAWLQARGLYSTVNAQTVAIHDGGYDDGTFTGGSDGLGDHHPDMETPDRLTATATFPGTATHEGDPYGHGTMVAGIIAGDVPQPNAAGAKDSGLYLYGLGIAPTAKIAAARFATTVGIQAVGTQQSGHIWSSARAPIINHSWNKFFTTQTGNFAVPRYDDMAQALDQWTLDADPVTAGAQRVLEIVAASNFAAASGSPQFDTVSSPATAKNVLTVGASESYRPISSGPGTTARCLEDASNLSRIAAFSGRGREFRPYPSLSLATNTRIKPDVVAPGVRVFSIVPFQYAPYSSANAVGCTSFSPIGSFYTYGSGTSFAAPVVSGVAALKRQQLVTNVTTTPSPSLLKAAIIATADSLGGQTGIDHRPSPLYGWGRVNLNRLTDARGTLIHNENAGTALTTGQERVFVGTVDAASSETRIVLVWSDVPSSTTGDSQAPLVNDLQLRVRTALGAEYAGNNFNEVVTGVDDGFSYQSVVGPFYLDSKNTVEAVFLPAGTLPGNSQVTLRVIGSNVASGPQKFSIYAYNLR